MREHDDLLAARYALGVADAAEIVTVTGRMASDAPFAGRIAFFENVFSILDRDVTPVAPPPGLWDRIERAIDDHDLSPDTLTLRTAELGWAPYAPGIERKVLHIDSEKGESIALYRLQPGAVVPNHSHHLPEECLVLEGEIEVDGVTVRAGDLHLAFPASRHGPLTSRTGAVVYLRGDLDMQP